MRIGAIVAAALAFALGGCMTNQQMAWVKPGVTVSEFDSDKARCQYEAMLGTPPTAAPIYRSTSATIGAGLGAAIADGIRQAELASLCMKAHGYILTAVATPPPPTDAVAAVEAATEN